MRKAAALLIVASAVVAIIAFATPVVPNLWSLATGRGYFVPPESSVFSFRATRMNEGSGEWWSYGEDSSNLFALHPSEPVYVSAARDAQVRCASFSPTDFTTWCSSRKHSLPRE